MPGNYTTQTVNNLADGTYNVTVTATGGCTATASATVDPSSGISATASATSTSCGLSNGSVTVTPSGGSGYTYLWMPGNYTTQTVNDLAAGIYTVTVTANGGCTATASAIVNPSSGISATASATPTSCGLPNGSVTATPTGGNGYTYLWMPGNFTTQIVNNLSSGTYNVTVTSGNGCTATSSATVDASSAVPSPSITGPSSVCSGGSVTLIAGAGYNTYAWSNNGGSSQNALYNNITSTTTFSVTVSNLQGCTAVALKEIIVLPLPDQAYTLNSNNGLFCSGDTARFLPTQKDNYEYIWSPDSIFFPPSGIQGGKQDYLVVITNKLTKCSSEFSGELYWKKELISNYNATGSGVQGGDVSFTLIQDLNNDHNAILDIYHENIKKNSRSFTSNTLEIQNEFQDSVNYCVVKNYIEAPSCTTEFCKSFYIKPAGTLDVVISTSFGLIACKDSELNIDGKKTSASTNLGCNNFIDSIAWQIIRPDGMIMIDAVFDGKDSLLSLDASSLAEGRYEIILTAYQTCNGNTISETSTNSFIILPLTLKPSYFITTESNIDLEVIDMILCPDIQYEITGLFADIIFDENIMHSGFNFKSGSQTIKDTLILNASAASMYTIPVEFTVTGGCTYQDTLLLNTRSTYDLRDDISLCMGDSVMLSVAEQFQGVKWQSIAGSLINKNGNTIIAGPLDGDSTVIDRVLVQGDREGCRYLDTFDITFIKVEGEIVPWPDTTCDLGLYRVVPGPDVVVDSISIPTGWTVDTFTNYIFKVGEAGAGSLGFRLKASGELTCSNTLLFSDPMLTPADPISELAYDACAGVLLVPQGCADAKGKWFYIDGESGELQTLEDTSLFAINIDTTSLKSGRYFFFCDSCGPVSASTRQDPQSTDPCDKNPTFELSLYPNPATTEVYLGLDRAAAGQVYCQITDMLGRQVYEAQWSHPGGRAITRIDSGGWSSGYYILMLRDQSGRRYVEKLIITQ
jgi:hypothetical protein